MSAKTLMGFEHYPEAAISINGILLNTGQSMTIRVALEHFAIDINDEGLGDDEHGKAMVAEYLARIKEIRSCFYTHEEK